MTTQLECLSVCQESQAREVIDGLPPLLFCIMLLKELMMITLLVHARCENRSVFCSERHSFGSMISFTAMTRRLVAFVYFGAMVALMIRDVWLAKVLLGTNIVSFTLLLPVRVLRRRFSRQASEAEVQGHGNIVPGTVLGQGGQLPDLALCSMTLGEAAQATCCICLEDMVKGDVVSQLPCDHRMHKSCLESWLRVCPSCPLRCDTSQLGAN